MRLDNRKYHHLKPDSLTRSSLFLRTATRRGPACAIASLPRASTTLVGGLVGPADLGSLSYSHLFHLEIRQKL